MGSIGTGHLVNDTADGLMTIYRIVEVVGHTSQLDAGYVFQAEQLAILHGLDDDILEF